MGGGLWFAWTIKVIRLQIVDILCRVGSDDPVDNRVRLSRRQQPTMMMPTALQYDFVAADVDLKLARYLIDITPSERQIHVVREERSDCRSFRAYRSVDTNGGEDQQASRSPLRLTNAHKNRISIMLMVRSLAISELLALFILLASMVNESTGLGCFEGLCKSPKPKPETKYDRAAAEALRKVEELEKHSRDSTVDDARAELLDEAAAKACDALLWSKVELKDKNARKLLETVAEAEDHRNVFPLGSCFEVAKASELLVLTNIKDEHCGNEDYQRRERELRSAAQRKHPILFNYLARWSRLTLDFCHEHPRQRILNFKSIFPTGWELIVRFGDAATKLAAEEGANQFDSRLMFRLFRPKGFKKRTFAELDGRDLDAVANINPGQLLHYCELFMVEYGRVSEKVSERRTASLTADELAKWNRYLDFCGDFYFMGEAVTALLASGWSPSRP